MKVPIFVWTVRADYTEARIPVDDTLGAMSKVFFKVNDGLEYQTYNAEDTKHMADDVYRPQGIDFQPWGVARGWNLEIARKEGHIAGEHAAAAQRPYILDLEPYKEDYWQGIPGTAHAFCDGYAETAEGQRLDLCPDARNPGLLLQEWVAEPVVDRILPQLYATAYGESLDLWIRKGVKPFLDLGVSLSRIFPVLAGWYQQPGEPSISPDDIERDIKYLASMAFPGCSIWRRGSISPEVVERILAMTDPFLPSPPVTPPPTTTDPLKTRLVPIGKPETAVVSEMPWFDWSNVPEERIMTTVQTITTKQRVRIVVDS